MRLRVDNEARARPLVGPSRERRSSEPGSPNVCLCCTCSRLPWLSCATGQLLLLRARERGGGDPARQAYAWSALAAPAPGFMLHRKRNAVSVRATMNVGPPRAAGRARESGGNSVPGAGAQVLTTRVNGGNNLLAWFSRLLLPALSETATLSLPVLYAREPQDALKEKGGNLNMCSRSLPVDGHGGLRVDRDGGEGARAGHGAGLAHPRGSYPRGMSCGEALRQAVLARGSCFDSREKSAEHLQVAFCLLDVRHMRAVFEDGPC